MNTELKLVSFVPAKPSPVDGVYTSLKQQWDSIYTPIDWLSERANFISIYNAMDDLTADQPRMDSSLPKSRSSDGPNQFRLYCQRSSAFNFFFFPKQHQSIGSISFSVRLGPWDGILARWDSIFYLGAGEKKWDFNPKWGCGDVTSYMLVIRNVYPDLQNIELSIYTTTVRHVMAPANLSSKYIHNKPSLI